MGQVKTNLVWLSPLDNCQNCNTPFGDGAGEAKIMIDAPLKLGNPWGNYCLSCAGHVVLGEGRGQKYELQITSNDKSDNPIKAWVKIDG